MSYSKIILMLVLLLAIVVSSCDEDPTKPEELLPAAFLPQNNEVAGWNRNYEVGNYLEAENTDGLVFMYEGDPNQKQTVETFIAHHFVRGVKQVYEGKIKGAPEYLDLRIFDLETAGQAQAFFHDDKIEPANFDYLSKIGEEARVSITSSEFVVTLDFYYEKWYCWIQINGRWGAIEAKQAALSFADLIYHNLLQYYPKES